jgi:glucose repression regulatory protein TUP1
MLSGSKDRCVLFWDMGTGTAHHIICAHNKPVIKVATSPVEDMFATAGGDMKMRLWKYSTAGKRSNLHDLLS